MVETARAKVVTIVASSELLERIEQDLLRLGAGGFTVSKVDGRGTHGQRVRGMFDIGNVRLETIVGPAKAEAILAHLAKEADSSQIIAYVHDVDAIPRKHFA